MTDSIAALHHAARYYCDERRAHWAATYQALVDSRRHTLARADGGFTYTDAAYGTFPRKHVLDAIRSEVEGFVPTDFTTLEEARALLSAAAWTAQNDFTASESSKATAAMNEEREAFVQFIERWTVPDERPDAAPPYCRTLAKAERERLFAELEAHWGVWYGGQCKRAPRKRQRHVTLHADVIDALPGGMDGLRVILRAQGIAHVIELCELGGDRELDVSLANFRYGGSEVTFVDRRFGWMIYASHEASITFGGDWLVLAVTEALPDVNRYAYRGWGNPPDIE